MIWFERFLLLCLVGLIGACAGTIPSAIDREMAFNENIRQSRCERHWLDGYCTGVHDRDWLTQVTEGELK